MENEPLCLLDILQAARDIGRLLDGVARAEFRDSEVLRAAVLARLPEKDPAPIGRLPSPLVGEGPGMRAYLVGQTDCLRGSYPPL